MAMIFNVAGLLKAGVGAVRAYELDGEAFDSPEGRFEDIAGVVKMTRTDRGVLVQASVSGYTDNECARCLEPAGIDLEVDLEEEFFPVNADLGPGSSLFREKMFEEEEPPDFWIDETNTLDLTEAVRQEFLGAMPLAPLCEAACKGICPKCGVNRNETECSCDDQNIDPRWASLLNIKL